MMQNQFPEALLDLQKWDQLSFAECVDLAHVVEDHLPSSFHFIKVETYEVGLQRHQMALFEWISPLEKKLTLADLEQIDPDCYWKGLTRNPDHFKFLPEKVKGEMIRKMQDPKAFRLPNSTLKQHFSRFVLIPGNIVQLGYDREHPVVPSAELVREWEEEHFPSPIRRLLTEWWQEHPFDDPSEEVIAQWEQEQLLPSGSISLVDGKLMIDEEKRPPDYLAVASYFEHNLSSLRTVTLQPFLLEAEVICIDNLIDLVGMYSTDEYPSFIFFGSSHGLVNHKQITGLLAKEGFRLPTSDEWEYACRAGTQTFFHWQDGFQVEQRPEIPSFNAFGLSIANDTYKWEFCDQPGLMHGGDGGTSSCGGKGRIADYLPLASSYILSIDPDRQIGAFFRRAYSLLQ